MRILIQAGHENRTSGATGAPGEQAFNKDVSDKVATQLRSLGVEVRRIDADPTATEVSGDWDLFLTIHYDADTYNADGGFVDFPEPSTDGATVKSQAIAKTLAEEYFKITGIRNVPSRSNANTRYYYMWKMISAKTPCVIIECGVGNRKPKDYDPLNTNRSLVVSGIMSGLKKALSLSGATPMPDTLLTYLGVPNETEAKTKLKEHLGERDSRSDWGNEEGDRGGFLGGSRRDVKRLQAEIEAFKNQVLTFPSQLETAKTEAYQRGFTDGVASVPSTNPPQPGNPADPTLYEELELVIETTEGNTKHIKKYRRKS